MKTLTRLIVPLLLGALIGCTDPDSGPVTVSPKNVTLKAGAKTTFTATVEDSDEPRIIWSVEGGDSKGTITSAGVYTAPAAAGTYTVVATNAVDTSKKDTATVKVEPADEVVVTVAVAPATVTLARGASTTFTATVTGSAITAVSWSVEGENSGTITSAGVYTAPATPGTYTVVATSLADASKKATATVTVPVTTGTADYQDPAGTGWRLVKNAEQSTGNRLVLDLVGPQGQSGRGVDLTLALDATQATWAPATEDATAGFVANKAFTLGSAPHLLKGTVKGGTLSVGAYQKGAPAQEYTGALISVALTVNTSDTTPAGTVIPLSVVKAHALPATGALQAIDVAVGKLTTK
jgi:hypothetical protein